MIKNRWLLFLGLAIGPFMVGIDFLAIGVAIEPMRQALGIDLATLGWFITAFAVGNSSFIAAAGKLADLYGHKLIFMLGLLLFVVSSGAISLTFSPLLIIVGRLFQGVSGGILFTVGVAILMTLYSPQERVAWISGLIGIGGLGMVLGPTLGGFLIHTYSWRAIFIINIPIGLIGLALIGFYVPAPTPSELDNRKLDLRGMLLFTVTLLLFTTAISQGHYWGFASRTSLVVFGLATLGALFFIRSEIKSSDPLIEFDFFKVTNFAVANFGGFILYFTVTAWILIFGIYLQRVMGLSAQSAGIALLPFGLILAIISLLMRWLNSRFTLKSLILAGYFLGVIAFLGMALIPLSPPLWLLSLLFGLYGGCFVLVNSNSIPVALAFLPAKKAGIAAGKVMMIRWLGGAIGSALTMTLFITQAVNYAEKKIKDPALQNHVHEIITSQKSESVSQEMGLMIEHAYHRGLVTSMFLLSLLSLIALIASKLWIRQKKDN